jgi:signal transduction histidine kinase
MIRKLKSRLTLIYGITSSIVLTIVILGIILLNYYQNYEQTLVQFQKNAEQVVEKIRSDNIVYNAWMKQMEQENHLLVVVEENGKRISPVSKSPSPEAIETMLHELKQQAEAEGIYLDSRPLSSKVEKTSVFNLNHSRRKLQLGMAVRIPKESSWLNVMVLYHDTRRNSILLRELIIFVFFDLLGTVALFLVSSLFIRKVLHPLEEGQRKQKEFIAAASHELRSPLTVIKTGIASMKEDMAKADRFLPHVEGECDRMSRLIDEMLLLAAADTNSWEMTWEQVDMDTLLIECYDMFCTCLNPKHAAITLDLPEERLCRIYGDKERLKQVLTILVDNAMSHIPEGGRIALRVWQQKHFLKIAVEDNGEGISPEDKPHVFERFFRRDQSRSDKQHYGLGLSIAKELVELHHGSITVEDTPGGGATFQMRLSCRTEDRN